ncbi:Mitochondrial distribution and morphology protein 12 [Coniochaeta pulveracea]|uniref:Mitochondrial distribution and morphology protein 12 n=1 Tax=Coniochaeta pulveracea TaxID=177199 RepID=A0A420XYE6_9PEZI|nr:Mitochondrial distribution and morphology protein 12 [Coniochaeta pulveracea]
MTVLTDEMSIDLNWETLTTGPDGLALASSIRDFIHTKFQSVPLPRFIKSVTVHDFQFGSVPPELELKDITDPLPDFYEEPGSSDEDDDGDDEEGDDEVPDGLKAAADRRRRAAGGAAGDGVASSATPPPGRITHHHPHPSHIHIPGLRSDIRSSSPVPSPFLGSYTPGIPGGTSNLHYFHSQFATGALSGTQTPLLAATGGHLFAGSDMHHSASSPELAHQFPGPGQPPVRGHGRNTSISSAISGLGPDDPSSTSPSFPSHHLLREKHSVSTLAPTSAGTSRPPTRDELLPTNPSSASEPHQPSSSSSTHSKPRPTPGTEDLQAVFRIRYAGDVRLLLTADILLDYPMPSFVGIPLRLSITGLTFDGVGVLAKIRKRAHFCFLSPEDALAAVGGEENLAMGEEGEGEKRKKEGGGGEKGKIGGLLQEIRVESEIGQREGGKTSLKNVGKVERFVLEQVRRIFEEEFVYPSFWTFLI